MILSKKHLSTKARSKRSEKRGATFLGGRVQVASGAINRFDLKADIKTEKYLVDDKTTNLGSFSINFALWKKLAGEAWMNKKRPMMRIESQSAVLYVVDELTLKELINSKG